MGVSTRIDCSFWKGKSGYQALASDKMRFYMPPMYLPNYRKIVDGTDTDIEQALMGNMAVEDLLAKWADKFEQANRDYQQKK